MSDPLPVTVLLQMTLFTRTVIRRCRSRVLGRRGIGHFHRRLLRFNTSPCHPMPLLAHVQTRCSIQARACHKDSLRGSFFNIGTIQRIFAWRVRRKDDAHTLRRVNNFLQARACRRREVPRGLELCLHGRHGHGGARHCPHDWFTQSDNPGNKLLNTLGIQGTCRCMPIHCCMCCQQVEVYREHFCDMNPADICYGKLCCKTTTQQSAGTGVRLMKIVTPCEHIRTLDKPSFPCFLKAPSAYFIVVSWRKTPLRTMHPTHTQHAYLSPTSDTRLCAPSCPERRVAVPSDSGHTPI